MSKIEHPKKKIKALENGNENRRIKDMVPKPKGTNAIRFLRRFRSKGPWLIVSIVPDDVVSARTFTDLEKARKFIVERNKTANIYYSINPTSLIMHKKPAKDDIARVTHLHADLDPKDDETSEAFKQHIWSKIECYKPEPSIIIDSGNGYQLLWCLAQPVKIDGPETVADIEARNYALAEAFGASASTRNIDRIFRVPGVTNYPNARKQKLGRVQCKAKLIEFNDRVHALSAFPKRATPTNTDSERHERDESGSGYGYRFMQERRSRGGFYTVVRKAILADQGPAGEWARRVDERQLRRAWDAPPPNTNSETRPLIRRSIDQFERRELEWLWYPFIPLGMITLLCGDKEVGKSSIILDVAARITKARPFPSFGEDQQQHAPDGSVIILCKENDIPRIIRPRLEAAKADLSRIHTLGYEVPDDVEQFDPLERLDTTVNELQRQVSEIGDVKLIMIDPITDYVGKIDMYRDDQVRNLLNPLGRIASQNNLAVVDILHLNKKEGLVSALSRSGQRRIPQRFTVNPDGCNEQ